MNFKQRGGWIGSMIMDYNGQEVDVRFLTAATSDSLKNLVDTHSAGRSVVDISYSVNDNKHYAKLVMKTVSERQQLNEGCL